MRKITVDGHTYQYKVGRGSTRFDTGNIVYNNELAGLTPDNFDRGKWKKTSDGMITPRMVAAYLRRIYGKEKQ